MRKFVVILCFVFSCFGLARASDAPAIKKLYSSQIWDLSEPRTLILSEPFRELYPQHNFLIPEFYTTHQFEYALNREALNFKADAQSEINSILDQMFSTSLGQRMLKTLENSGIKKLKISLLFFPGEKRFVDSWTDGQINTSIFLSESQLNRRHLLKVFTHEVAQMTHSYSLQLSENNHLDLKFPNEILNCGLDQLSKRPDFRILVSTLRAFAAEDIVLGSLNYSARHSRATSCGFRIARTWQMLNLYNLTIDKEVRKWVKASPAACSSSVLVQQFIQTLNESEHGELFCNALEVPLIGSEINRNGTFGPRPPIGAGGD